MSGEPVAVAWANDEAEAGLIQGLLEEGGIDSFQQQVGINGPQVGIGLLNPGGGARRIMVEPDRAEAARDLLAGALVEGEALTEPVNAEYLEDATGGRKPRGYGVLGAYARMYFWGFGLIAVIFGVFMLLRVL